MDLVILNLELNELVIAFSRHTSTSFTVMTKNEDSIIYPAVILLPVMNNCFMI